jgi:hypothetical protein
MGQGIRRLAALTLIVVLVLASAMPAGAWGPKGHRLVGEIARQLLSDDARSAIVGIMGSDDLARFALYLDDNKDDLDEAVPGSRDWHYDDVPVCGTASYGQYCHHKNCASSQIPRHEKILADPHAAKKDRRFAVRVLTHLIGDIHQPLHAADNHDVGGNQVSVLLPKAKKEAKLHGVWDGAFVNHLWGGKDEEQVATALIAQFKEIAAKWQKGNAFRWIEESHRIAVETVYGKLPGFACGADLEDKTIKLPEAYVQAAVRLMPEQIAKGGFRLAYVLNRALQD